MRTWTSLEQFFSCLNDAGTYAVLRNYETGFVELTQNQYGDIDILCSSLAMVKNIGG